MNPSIKVLTPGRWSDLEKLFGDRGACGGCWCMAWRLKNKDWIAGKGAKNKRRLKKLVLDNQKPGVLAYEGTQPIGWCSVAPRKTFSFLARSRVLKPVDDQDVWSVSCLFVRKSFRQQGVSAELLKGAAAFAVKNRARILEGYPVIPTMASTPDPFLWTGLPSAFKAAGFRKVAQRSKTRPIMRLRLRSN